MTHSVVHLLGIPFAIVAGTGAGVFALLSWGIFRNSPFGTAIALLSVGMVALTIYHTMLLVAGPESLVLHVLRSAANTIVAIFLGLLILRHRQLRGNRSGGDLAWTD
ncbi:hypothetical protein [Haloterrigena alkaliphila]|uniref:Uncharacterized protein n=1 Tax=Haloterrigena alkaliphila TaxID=2816475 RepID=A0A8A2VDY5_9EURY|nr:hypothetical protein [Haloterrigena alkaliphila]QSW98634.1 hypothetical protein J0X25_14730 [Haloterrigena alkaliphila]